MYPLLQLLFYSQYILRVHQVKHVSSLAATRRKVQGRLWQSHQWEAPSVGVEPKTKIILSGRLRDMRGKVVKSVHADWVLTLERPGPGLSPETKCPGLLRLLMPKNNYPGSMSSQTSRNKNKRWKQRAAAAAAADVVSLSCQWRFFFQGWTSTGMSHVFITTIN